MDIDTELETKAGVPTSALEHKVAFESYVRNGETTIWGLLTAAARWAFDPIP